MLIRPMMLLLPVARTLVRWADADPNTWTISNNGLTASRPSESTTNTLVRATPNARTNGPAAFSVKVDGVTSSSNSMLVGLYAPDASLSPTGTTNRVTWRPDGAVVIGGAVDPTSAPTYTTGDTLTFRLGAAGTSLTLLKNGAVAGTYSITNASRVPGANALASGPVLTINGAPAGETPWG